MKLAIIPPIKYLEDFSTNYHLVLAHLYAKDDVYRAFYKSRKSVGDFIILDNGAAELGTSITHDTLFYLAADLKPNVLVCPDTLRDADATIRTTDVFMGHFGDDLDDLGIRLMGVPQGEDYTAWYRVYDYFNRHPHIAWLGISKYAPLKRLDLLSYISDSVNKSVHLLGMADDVYAIEREKAFPFVHSTDTAVPIKLGMQGLVLDYYKTRYKKMSDDVYFNYPRGMDKSLHNQVLANIGEYTERCR